MPLEIKWMSCDMQQGNARHSHCLVAFKFSALYAPNNRYYLGVTFCLRHLNHFLFGGSGNASRKGAIQVSTGSSLAFLFGQALWFLLAVPVRSRNTRFLILCITNTWSRPTLVETSFPIRSSLDIGGLHLTYRCTLFDLPAIR